MLDDYSVSSVQELLPYLTTEEREEVFALLAQDTAIFRPLPGPQTAAYHSVADITGYGGAAGGGKLLPLDTLLPTPDGFVCMGDVRVGSTLFDKDGALCRVAHVSPVQTPEMLAFEFDDGTTITSCVDHQWLTFDAVELAVLTRRDEDWKARRRAKRPSRATGRRSEAFTKAVSARNSRLAEGGPLPEGSVRTSQQIADTLLTKKGRRNHAVPLAGVLDLPKAELPIDPYTLGAWLGDGTSVSGGFTGVDPQIWQEIERAGYEVRHRAEAQAHHICGLIQQLRPLDLLANKHIPMAYLRASKEQRLALLQGLMDTDGTVARNSGAAEFCNTNKAIVDGVEQLVCSLGWKVRVRESRSRLNGRDCGPKWTLKFVASEYVFRLERKREIQKLASRRTTKFRYIVDARPAPSVEGRCIQVDSPSSTYLASAQCIPTHNTFLACGLALTAHRKTMMLRREGTQLTGIIDELTGLLGGRDGFNGQDKIWRLPDGRQIELGSTPNNGDERRYQGRPHDFICFDEASNFLEAQVRFLMGWLRTTIPNQRCRALLCFNPPTNAEGRWIIDFFGPWLDPKHPIPAAPGELRYFATVNGKDLECADATPFVINDGVISFDFDPGDYRGDQIIKPMSRTFIPSRIGDNPFLTGTGYMNTLQALPEPLRSQMLLGDFQAGVSDDPWQVIPTAWIEAAQARWRPLDVKPKMDSMGVDVARGGKDTTTIARRHGQWYDEPLVYPGSETPDGPTVAGLVISASRNQAPIHIDVIGVGASPYDFLKNANQQIMGVNVAETSMATDKSGRLRFSNQRSQYWWQMRELLDPNANNGVALPPDRELLVELSAPKWSLRGDTIYVESRDEIIKRIGRSPDRASAYLLAMIDTPRMSDVANGTQSNARRAYDPYGRKI